MNIVLLLDPRGALSKLDKPTIERQKNYIQSLNNLESNNYTLLILTGTNIKTPIIIDDCLQINRISSRTWNPLKFAFRASKFLVKNEMNPKLILAGDPWFSFFSAYLLKSIIRKNIPIQVQIHADISDRNWKKINLRNKLKASIIRFSVNQSSSIRVVTPEIASWISNKYKFTKSKIVISPIPLNIGHSRKPTMIPNSLGMVGRMENDRGVSLLPIIASLINKFDPTTKLILIGEGSLLPGILEELANKVPSMDVKNYGYLSGIDFENKINEIGVLLSLAPSESYGRTVRECLLLGIPVLAINSKSLKYLEKRYPESGLKTFEIDELYNGNIDVKIAQLRDIGVKENLKRHILSVNEDSSRILAKSWNNLIKNGDKSKN
jgi:glycosyltransferase involved in cell wall biosynthesis